MTTSAPPPDDDALPEEIGGHRVFSVLGEGGMGKVYAAEDESLGRTVAIKVLLPSLAGDPEMRARFSREARAMARVSSPHVVTVFQVGAHEDRPFLVMEVLEGEDLSQLLKRAGKLSPAQSVAFTLEAIKGLKAAQEAGVIHRDVKPANLFVIGAGGPDAGHVKLTDFGLARPLDGSSNLTQAGLVVGTPHYLAPELARGEDATVQSDIYALGATLFELLAGRPPFDAPSPMDVVSAHLKEAPPDLRALADIPGPLADVVLRMLNKEPNSRYDDYDTLTAALQDALDEEAGSPGAASKGTMVLGTPGEIAKTAEDTAAPTSSEGAADDIKSTDVMGTPRVSSPSNVAVKTAPLTVMFTDIAGYTERTGQQSREEAHRWLELHDQLMLPIFKAFGGKLRKTIGDAFLVTFQSPTDAVHCGLAIQDRLWAHNKDATNEELIRVRVALSAGEVRLHKGDIFGEPVNLAARIESLAEPGQVMLSDAVYATMNTAEVKLTRAGEHQFKGIGRTVTVYAAVPDGIKSAAPFGNRALERVPDTTAAALMAQAASNVGEQMQKLAEVVAPKSGGLGRGKRALAAGLSLVVAIGAVVALVLLGGEHDISRIDDGEAEAVLKEKSAIKRKDRTGTDERIRGHALYATGETKDAFKAYARALELDSVDDRMKAAAFAKLHEQYPHGAVELLEDWPDPAIERELRDLLDEDWWARHHALRALEKREVATEEDHQAVGLRDLSGDSCQQRKHGLRILKRHGQGDDVLDAIRALHDDKLGNVCLFMDLSSTENAVQRRTEDAAE